MRRRRCQRLLKVLRWDIITLMALLEQLVLPAEDQSSFFLDWRESTLRASASPLFDGSRPACSPFRILLNSECSGPWCHEARNSSCDLNICRLAAVFLTALPTGAGLDAFTDMSGRHQLVVRLCYDEYDEVGLIHQYNTGCLQEALFPGLIRKHGSVHEYGPGLISLRAGGGGYFLSRDPNRPDSNWKHRRIFCWKCSMLWCYRVFVLCCRSENWAKPAEVYALLHHQYFSRRAVVRQNPARGLFCCEWAEGRLQLWPPHIKTAWIPPPADRWLKHFFK